MQIEEQKTHAFGAIALVLVMLIGGAFVIRWGVQELFSSPHTFSDFPAYQFAAKVMSAGGDPYDIDAVSQAASNEDELLGQVVAPFRHSPLVLLPFVAIDSLSYAHARQVWIALVFLSIMAVSFVLWKYLSPWEWEDPRSWMLALIPLVFTPLIYSMGLHQINSFLLLSLFLGFLCFKKKKYTLAAVFFGLAVAGKFFLGVIVLALLFQKQYRLALLSLVFAVFFFVAPFIFFPTTFSGYTDTVVPELLSGELHDNPNNPVPGSGSIAWWKNVSFDGFASRAFTRNTVVPPLVEAPVAASVIRLIGYLVFAGTLLLLWKFRLRLQGAGVLGLACASGVLVLAWFLASTFAWQHHLVFLLLLLPAAPSLSIQSRSAIIGASCSALGLLGINVIASPPAQAAVWVQQVYAFIPTAGLVALLVGCLLLLFSWKRGAIVST